MRVNVYKESISKTLMNGLKVFSNKNKFNKSNKRKSLENYLKFNRIIKETLAASLATLLKSSTLKLAVATIASALIVLIEIFLNLIGFCRLTVLMNDFRLKTFYCKLTKQPKTSSSASASLTFLSTTTSSSSSTTSATTTTSSVSLLSSSNNNNHNRTYNNSSKSNKVFLYYTPRDPRLRIFLKTKHFNRPVLQSQFNNKNNNNSQTVCSKKVFNLKNNNSLLKATDDLCNYGELIGGVINHKNCYISNNSNCSNYQNCAGVNKTSKLINNKNSNSANSLNNNKTTTITCDNLSKTSDNCVVAAAASTLTTSAAAVNIIVSNIIIAVVIKYFEELYNFIEILLR